MSIIRQWLQSRYRALHIELLAERVAIRLKTTTELGDCAGLL